VSVFQSDRKEGEFGIQVCYFLSFLGTLWWKISYSVRQDRKERQGIPDGKKNTLSI